MAAALADDQHGYYRRADPLGRLGDFTTAPEISQLFGELIGAWLIDTWERLGSPTQVNLVELGPGRGTLMADALRIGHRVARWLDAIRLHLVEINPYLRARQAEALSVYAPIWHDSLSSVPEGPTLLVANEFFDAMPVRQLVFRQGAWRERLVGWNETEGLHFALAAEPSPISLLIPPDLPPPSDGEVWELSPAGVAVADEIARRTIRHCGAALIVDYGRADSAYGASIQAVRGHRTANVLESPGEVDLSAYVDFTALARTAREAGANAAGPVGQGAFLDALGIRLRADRLRRGAAEEAARAIDEAVDRLTGPAGMGTLFKAMAITPAGLNPAGFETDRKARSSG